MKPTRRGFLGGLLAGALTPLTKKSAEEPVTITLDGLNALRPEHFPSPIKQKVSHGWVCSGYVATGMNFLVDPSKTLICDTEGNARPLVIDLGEDDA